MTDLEKIAGARQQLRTATQALWVGDGVGALQAVEDAIALLEGRDLMGRLPVLKALEPRFSVDGTPNRRRDKGED